MKKVTKTLAAVLIAALIGGCATINHVGNFIKPSVKFKPCEMVKGKSYIVDTTSMLQYPVVKPAKFLKVEKNGKCKNWYVFCTQKSCFLVPQLRVLRVATKQDIKNEVKNGD